MSVSSEFASVSSLIYAMRCKVKFYEKLGFKVVDSVVIEAPTGDWVQHLLVREQPASR